MSHVLDKIVAHKRDEIEALKAAQSVSRLESAVDSAPKPRDFAGALRLRGPLALIAEVKRASPSAGLIRPDFDPTSIARTYAAEGAACISVLTDEKFFQGSLDDLCAVRAAVDVPILRKDFILDRYQILEARAAGADCVLLIAECLPQRELAELHEFAGTLGLQVLIELYEPENLERVLSLRPELVGVNNRNLKTMQTDLAHSLHLRERVPDDVLFVSESGIHCRADVDRLREHGIQAMLVGETLMRSEDMGAKVRELLGT